jgi:hypothetical protein
MIMCNKFKLVYPLLLFPLLTNASQLAAIPSLNRFAIYIPSILQSQSLTNRCLGLGAITSGAAALWSLRKHQHPQLTRVLAVASCASLLYLGYNVYRQPISVATPIIRQPNPDWEEKASGDMTMQSQIQELIRRPGSAAIPLAGGWVALGLTGQNTALLQKNVAWEKQRTPWKLHISANCQNAAYIMSTVKGVLWHFSPLCKVLRDENVLEHFNACTNQMIPELGRYKAGRLFTIYAQNNTELLNIAQALNHVLVEAIRRDKIPDHQVGTENHTDRPIGTTGHLWARHSQAGAPLTTQSYRAQESATASEGNYRITYYLSDYAQNGTGGSTKHSDIFEQDWGTVHWDKDIGQFVLDNPQS